MAAPVTVTDDEITEAARGLATSGRAVNGWSLRRVIGRGDPERLAAVWEAARRADTAPAESAVPVVLPPVLSDLVASMVAGTASQLGDFAARVWVAAERLAAERAGGEAEAARAEAADLRHQLDEARDIIRAADERAEAAEAQAVDATAAAAEVREAAAADVARARDDLRAALDAVGRMQPSLSGAAARMKARGGGFQGAG